MGCGINHTGRKEYNKGVISVLGVDADKFGIQSDEGKDQQPGFYVPPK
jgi:hypothetical protein